VQHVAPQMAGTAPGPERGREVSENGVGTGTITTGKKTPGTNALNVTNVTFSPAVREQTYLIVMNIHSVSMGKSEKIILRKKRLSKVTKAL